MLTHTLTRFLTETQLVPVIGAELEFYAPACIDALPDAFMKDCYQQFGSNGILTQAFVPESHAGQFEIALVHIPDAAQAAQNIEQVREIIQRTALSHQLDINFAAKPFVGKPGSGMHIHISLYNREGQNQFSKPEADGADESALLRHAIAGLCATMAESMLFFAPHAEDYARFTAEFYTHEEQCYSYVPVNVSWGGNNRTTALRVPTSTLDPAQRHIEHRVPCANANPDEVIAAILLGVQHGLTQKLEPPAKIWGNAFDAQYALPALPKTLEEAKAAYEGGVLNLELRTVIHVQQF